MVKSISVTAKEKRKEDSREGIKTSYLSPIGNSRGNELTNRVTGTFLFMVEYMDPYIRGNNNLAS